ncbi:MAG: patatin-like phospholipase family protein [Oscillospiraceae bacterium]|jgi:NTE family protein|nr:patatin-like phospholipase family protein [Oscillospiraceae bacterium]
MFGLALQGGGALGAAHLGVLRALTEASLLPEAIGGTSAGSMAAAAYAWRGKLSDVEELFADVRQMGARLLDLNVSGLLKMAGHWFARRELNYLGVFKGNRLERLMDDHLEGAMIRDARMPLVIPSVDLVSGDLILYASRPPAERGPDHWELDVPLSAAVRASVSIPIVFVPKPQAGELLVDGGVLMDLPVSPVTRMGADRVMGVSLTVEGEDSSRPDDVVGVARTMIKAVGKQLERQQRRHATYVLDVILPRGNGMFSFDNMDEFADIGYETAMRAMPEMKAAFSRTVPVSSRAITSAIGASARFGG